jgi:hypothetical protein
MRTVPRWGEYVMFAGLMSLWAICWVSRYERADDMSRRMMTASEGWNGEFVPR